VSARTAMTTLTLARAAELAGAEIRMPGSRGGHADPGAIAIAGASIDTRTLGAGRLFVPLSGQNADGHEFLGAAFERGAAGALCARDRWALLRGREPGPLLVVDDVTAALQRLAAGYRDLWDGVLIGVTGSSGKTTTKELVAAAVSSDRPTLATRGNLNNHWGVPLTLLDLEPAHGAAVIEMGSNHPGEIAALAAIARPEMAIVTNAGTAHLEHYGSVEAIAREKASLAFALPESGVAFVGADSPALIAALGGLPARLVTYGLDDGAQLRPRRLEDLGPRGTRLEVEGFPSFVLPLVGRHQAVNALAAIGVARELRLDPTAVIAALGAIVPAQRRMEVKRAAGATVLVDCYNANPESTRAALATLAQWPGAARRIAVLGDMLELGREAGALHRATAAAARDTELWVVGAHAGDYEAGAHEAGIEARVFADKAALAEALAGALAPGTAVLVKASRGARLEDVLSGIEWGP
jgi:UDP-N-acetylmuramoyl-tripeptide--D-alanyl-D-alanine ligase